jgi:hypothetical protein
MTVLAISKGGILPVILGIESQTRKYEEKNTKKKRITRQK